MSSGPPEKPTDLDQVYAEAYRSYLRSLRDGLANLDIDALDLSGMRAPAHPGTALFSIGYQASPALFSIGGQTQGSSDATSASGATQTPPPDPDKTP